MLSIMGTQPGRYCDGVDRRSFLKIGGLAMGGLGLPQLLQAEASQGLGRSRKSIIMIFLSGGPPHQDMFDLKMEAPVEIRGEFQPIRTNVTGIEICEHLPRMAGMMDQMVAIRSVVGSEGRHAAFQCLTGNRSQQQPAGGWPSMGSVVSKLQGPTVLGIPPFVSLTPPMKGRGWADPGQAGFAGQAHAPFTPNSDGKANLQLNRISLETLGDRQQLLGEA